MGFHNPTGLKFLIMEKRKVCVVITARPSYSRIKTTLQAIKIHPDLELQIVLAGPALLNKYGNIENIIQDDGFTIAERVYTVLDGENLTSMAKTVGIGLVELSNVFYQLKPHMVVVIADRFETIAVSIAAAYQNIPLVHIPGVYQQTWYLHGVLFRQCYQLFRHLVCVPMVCFDKQRQ